MSLFRTRTTELVKRVKGKFKHDTLKSGSYFGDEVLKGKATKYASTVVALQTTSVWRLEQAAVKSIVHPMLQQLKEKQRQQQQQEG